MGNNTAAYPHHNEQYFLPVSYSTTHYQVMPTWHPASPKSHYVFNRFPDLTGQAGGVHLPGQSQASLDQYYVPPPKHKLIRGPREDELPLPDELPILAFTDVLELLYNGRTKEEVILEKLAQKEELYKQVCGLDAANNEEGSVLEDGAHRRDLAEVGCRTTDVNGWTVLHWAVQNDFYHVACYMLRLEAALGLEEEYSKQICAQDEHGLTPVMLAVYVGSESMLELLLLGVEPGAESTAEGEKIIPGAPIPKPADYGFLFEVRNNYDCTALHYAAMRDRVKMMHFLGRLCPDIINAEDRNGDTALHHACFHMFPLSITALLQLGANGNIRNHVSKLPLDIVLESDRMEPRILKELHRFHEENLPPLMNAAEIRQEVQRITADETTRRFRKKQLVKKEMGEMLRRKEELMQKEMQMAAMGLLGPGGPGKQRAEHRGSSMEGAHRSAHEEDTLAQYQTTLCEEETTLLLEDREVAGAGKKK
eukprot:g10186.t1